jgi:hypothetical protein
VRKLANYLIALALAITLSGCNKNPITPAKVADEGASGGGGTGQTTRIQGVGCFLQGAAAGGGSLASMLAAGMVFFPSRYPNVDAFNQQEGLNLVGTFQLSPRMFYLMDDSGPNAYATPEIANALGPDGTILFGQTLLAQQLTKDPTGASVVAIMAHEFGHLAQFRQGFREPGKRPELHADFMAGWYLSVRGRYAWTNLMPTLKLFFELGDYQFNSQSHHGTPQERLGAAQAGFSSGAATAAQAYALGWQFVK